VSPKEKPTEPLDVYVRVSRVNDREGDSFQSPQVQEERCRALLVSKGLQAGGAFVDLDETGGQESRPALDRALARIAEGVSGGLVVYKLNRLGRRRFTEDIIVNHIEAHGATFISCSEDINTSTPMGRAFLRFINLLSELELETVTEGWEISKDKALDRGAYIGLAPTGYEKLADGTLRKNGGAEQIAKAYQLRADGGSWQAVARALDGVEHGRRGKGGDWLPGYPTTSWTSAGALKLLTSQLHKGTLGWYSNKTECFRSELVITPPSVWAKANERKAEPGKRHRPGKALLAGLLRCTGCGRVLSASTTKRGEHVYTYYSCKSGRAFCSAPASIKGEVAEQKLIDEARSYLEELSLEGLFTVGRDSDPERLAELEKALSTAKARARRALRTLDSQDPEDAAELDEIDAEVEAAQKALAEEQAASQATEGPEEIRAIFAEGEVEEVRQALRLILLGAEVSRGGGIEIVYVTPEAEAA
jgi:site-specific DNA recombinase